MKTQPEVDSRDSILGNILDKHAMRVSINNAIEKEVSKKFNEKDLEAAALISQYKGEVALGGGHDG